jgi:glycosyltransferase involved in cell wall biosynthesis
LNTLHHFAQYLAKHYFTPSIAGFPEEAPRMIVVIPSYNEPGLIRSLESLSRCRLPSCFTEVIVVVNHPEHATRDAKQQNEENLRDAQLWANQHNDKRLQFHLIYKPEVPEKTAGAGYARKTGMDEAVFRFLQAGVDDGIIIGFDADSTCDENYFEEIERTFFTGTPANGASIYYEHPVDGNEYDAAVYDGIVLYELHLRYLNQALRYSGFPYAYHTVGSSFAVSATTYVRQGGMNQRKAGEDFHFLQKIIPLGNYVEINTTRVIPSPRPSDRVPFGTGASIRQWMSNGQAALQTYPLEPFEDLKQLFSFVPNLYKANRAEVEKRTSLLPCPMQDYLFRHDHIRYIAQANDNSASSETFTKRFFTWFDGLKTVKYLNNSCRQVYGKQTPESAANRLLKKSGYENNYPARELLRIYRNIERQMLNS